MKYFALLTKLGENLLAQATALGTKLELTHMAVGDGGGSLPTPDTNQTKLIAEKRRAAINTLFIDDKNKNQIIAEQIIPEQDGGWWIREIGLFDKAGNLIAVANCPETYKPQLAEGSGRTQSIRMVLVVSHTESVTLKIDPSVVLATREYVNTEITVLDKKIDALSAQTKLDLTKKIDKANISGQKGNDNDKVPSLNLFTTEIGKLAALGYSYSKIESDGRYQPKGEYATSQALNDGLSKKFDIANISQAVGPSPNHVMSQDASTKTFQPKGDYLKVGMFGFGGEAVGFNGGEFNGITATGVYKGSGNGAPGNELSWGSVLHLQRQEGRATQLGFWKGIIGSRSQINLVWDDWVYAYSEANTTKDPSGFVRASGSAVALTTSNLSQGIGQSQTHVMSQKVVTDSLYGVSQSWVNVTKERVSGTVYTNSTGKAISVSLSQGSTGQPIYIEVTVNDVIISTPSSSSGAARNNVTFTVPAGRTYKVVATGTNISNWSELR